VAEANLEANGLTGKVTALEATGFDAPELVGAAPYDLVIANILKGPLMDLAQAMAQATAPGGHAILSGLLTSQAEEIVAHYAQAGYDLVSREDIGEWSTLVLVR
jgi:ribosomal protein L11 methyltransferase